MLHVSQCHSRSWIRITSCEMGGLWQCWCQGELQPSQKTIMLLSGLWPRPQFLQTAASPGLRRVGLWGSFSFSLAGAFLVLLAGVLGGGGGFMSVGGSRSIIAEGLKVVAWVIRRPERDWVRGA